MGHKQIQKGLEAKAPPPVGAAAFALRSLDEIEAEFKALDDIPNAIAEIAQLRNGALAKINAKAAFSPRGVFESDKQEVIKQAADKIAEAAARLAAQSAALLAQAPLYSRDACAARAFSRLDPAAQTAIFTRIDRATGPRLVVEAREAAARGDLATADAIYSRIRDTTAATRDERAQVASLLAMIASPADKFAALQRADAIRRQQALVNHGAATAPRVRGLERIRLGMMKHEDATLTAASPAALPVNEYLKTRADRLARGESV